MLTLLTFVSVFLLVIVASYVVYRVRFGPSPARKKLSDKEPEGGDMRINMQSPFKVKTPDFEVGKELISLEVSPNKSDFFFPEENETQIVALVKNPFWIYLYWDIGELTREDFESMHGPGSWQHSAPVLRVNNLTQQSQEDIFINDAANSWYLNVNKPGHQLYIELGRKFPDGRFITLACSNLVSLPAAAVSSVIDPKWQPQEAVWSTIKIGDPVKGLSNLSSPELQRKD